MVTYLRREFPAATLMFRPESYTQSESNGATYVVRESAIATMHFMNVPIFRCKRGLMTFILLGDTDSECAPIGAEKLIGELDMCRFSIRVLK